MFFTHRRYCCCGGSVPGGNGGGDAECLFCWSLRSGCSECPDEGPTGGNGISGCDPQTDATCENVHGNLGRNDCVGCTYTYNESQLLCYFMSLCPCVWVCEHAGCTTTEDVPGGGISTPCDIVVGCPEIIDNRLQCKDTPCPEYTQECEGCSSQGGQWRLVQDPYASAGNAEPTCTCCCTGYTGQIVSC